MLNLYQFPLSHYCEKVAWAIDHKGLPCRKINLLPGPHVFRLRRLSGDRTVPVLVDGDKVIRDSSKIITYLDKKYPKDLLTPEDPVLCTQALGWEKRLDEEIGANLRRWGYWHLLRENPKAILNAFLHDQSTVTKKIYPCFFPLLKTVMRRDMRIYADEAEKSRQILFATMEELDRFLENKTYLVGDAFTRADLAACALLYPMVRPPEHPMAEHQIAWWSETLNSHSEIWRDTRLFEWVKRIYAEYRGNRNIDDFVVV